MPRSSGHSCLAARCWRAAATSPTPGARSRRRRSGPRRSTPASTPRSPTSSRWRRGARPPPTRPPIPARTPDSQLVVANRPPDRRVDIVVGGVITEVRLVLDGQAFRCARDADAGRDHRCERTDAVVDPPGVFDERAVDRLTDVARATGRRLHVPHRAAADRRRRGHLPRHRDPRRTRAARARRPAAPSACPPRVRCCGSTRATRRSRPPTTAPRSPTRPSCAPTATD